MLEERKFEDKSSICYLEPGIFTLKDKFAILFTRWSIFDVMLKVTKGQISDKKLEIVNDLADDLQESMIWIMDVAAAAPEYKDEIKSWSIGIHGVHELSKEYLQKVGDEIETNKDNVSCVEDLCNHLPEGVQKQILEDLIFKDFKISTFKIGTDDWLIEYVCDDKNSEIILNYCNEKYRYHIDEGFVTLTKSYCDHAFDDLFMPIQAFKYCTKNGFMQYVINSSMKTVEGITKGILENFGIDEEDDEGNYL